MPLNYIRTGSGSDRTQLANYSASGIQVFVLHRNLREEISVVECGRYRSRFCKEWRISKLVVPIIESLGTARLESEEQTERVRLRHYQVVGQNFRNQTKPTTKPTSSCVNSIGKGHT
jgi:hypothetical protein